MLSNLEMNEPWSIPVPRTRISVPAECGLCGGRRADGSGLASGPVGSAQMLWVCLDCQHKLARGVDDDGVLGG